MNQPMNARETWKPYDTVIVGASLGATGGVRWYPSFASIGEAEYVPFFNQRNRSAAGLWATNMDAKESMPFVYHIYNIGVQFSAPCTYPVLEYSDDGEENRVGPTLDLATHVWLQWAELLKHTSVILKVSQDDKLVANALALPAGYGTFGIINVDAEATMDGVESGAVQTMGNGIAQLDNVFGFPIPVAVPRNCIFEVQVKFSKYARELLKRMEGPGKVMINTAPASVFTLSDATVDGMCMIEVTLNGRRAVQLRNQQRFSA
jgi:hypothetical protein